MSDYLEIFYDKKNKPYTAYPEKFVSYIFQKYQMEENQSLLELGVGRGEHLRLFKESGLKVSGLDISKKSKELSPDMDIKVLDADSEKWPYPDNSFDFVYSKSFVEHLHQPTKYFLEAFRVLKPGGTIITLTPNWESQYKTFFDDYTHISPFTPISLKNIQTCCGLEHAKSDKFRQLPITWRYPFLNIFCALISPFIPVRTKIKLLRWSRELMLIGSSEKPRELLT
jgi:ubiquinone/menaquinone biosynthesis C-methylase UbiE